MPTTLPASTACTRSGLAYPVGMELKSLTYTSLATMDLSSEDLTAIHRTALKLNSLDGLTGLLVFNGTHFLQIVEGTETAVNDLLARLRSDSRHFGLEVRDEREVGYCSFPDWSMELVKVEASYFEASETLKHCIPGSVPSDVRERLYKMTESISSTVRL